MPGEYSKVDENTASKADFDIFNDETFDMQEIAEKSSGEMDRIFGKRAVEAAGKIIGESFEQNAEKPIMCFGSYVDLCNKNNDGSRARGILSEELYEYIVSDLATEFVNLDDQRVPALIDVRYGLGMGYDESKCREYADGLSDVRILAIPAHEIKDDAKDQLGKIFSSYDKLALYFGDHDGDESSALNQILSDVEISHREKPLIDERTKKSEDGQASLYLYSCRVEQVDEINGERLTVRDVKDYYDNQVVKGDVGNEDYIGPVYFSYNKKDEKTGNIIENKTKTVLEMGNEISPESAQKLWDVYNKIFDELGKCKHPISMQDGIDEFMGLLKSKNTILSVTYGIGKTGDFDEPICFTYFVDDMSKLYWLNESYLNDKKSDEEMNNLSGHVSANNTCLFTPGIVSSAMGVSLSHLPIELFVNAGCKTGMSASIFFENTNFSKEYIPRLVDRYASRVCKKSNKKIAFTESKLIDQVSYRLWTIGREEK